MFPHETLLIRRCYFSLCRNNNHQQNGYVEMSKICVRVKIGAICQSDKGISV